MGYYDDWREENKKIESELKYLKELTNDALGLNYGNNTQIAVAKISEILKILYERTNIMNEYINHLMFPEE